MNRTIPPSMKDGDFIGEVITITAPMAENRPGALLLRSRNTKSYYCVPVPRILAFETKI